MAQRWHPGSTLGMRVAPILAGPCDGMGCADMWTWGGAPADTPGHMQEWDTQDPAVSSVLTSSTAAPRASEEWVLGWEER